MDQCKVPGVLRFDIRITCFKGVFIQCNQEWIEVLERRPVYPSSQPECDHVIAVCLVRNKDGREDAAIVFVERRILYHGITKLVCPVGSELVS